MNTWFSILCALVLLVFLSAISFAQALPFDRAKETPEYRVLCNALTSRPWEVQWMWEGQKDTTKILDAKCSWPLILLVYENGKPKKTVLAKLHAKKRKGGAFLGTWGTPGSAGGKFIVKFDLSFRTAKGTWYYSDNRMGGEYLFRQL